MRRMVFQTHGKKVVFNDMKLGVTANKTWKGKKHNEFFNYNDHKGILKFTLADIDKKTLIFPSKFCSCICIYIGILYIQKI